MNLNGFENLKDLSKNIENDTQGELCTHLGNSVNSPIDDGLGMFNKAVTVFDTYRDNTVAINESVEYVYDIKPIYDRLDVIESYLSNKLKQVNEKEMQERESAPISDDKSEIAFLKHLSDETDGVEDFGALKAAINDSQRPPSLTTDIRFKDKNKFLSLLKMLFKNEDPKVLDKIISSASGFISTFDINSVREFINKVNEKVHSGKFYQGDIDKDERSKQLNLLVGDIIRYVLRQFDGSDDDIDLTSEYESAVNFSINEWLPKAVKHRASDNKWIDVDMEESLTGPKDDLSKITVDEVRESVLNEFRKSGPSVSVLRQLYLDE